VADKDSREGKSYQTPEVIKYVNDTHAPHDGGLAQAFAVPQGVPAIQVGPSEGKFLALLLQVAGAKRVVEVGTLVGYSAIHMARALPADGHVYSIESDPKHAELARENIAAAGLSDRISVHVGAGVDVLPTLESHGPFDAVFIDADKSNYDRYGQWATQHLRKGGLVIGDNAFLFGELLEDADRGRAMRRFHEHVARTCDSVCLPTPDGLVIGIKR
jgi:caffeoyl-CoA O-methyltransferase